MPQYSAGYCTIARKSGPPLPISGESAAQGTTDVWPVSCNALDAPCFICPFTLYVSGRGEIVRRNRAVRGPEVFGSGAQAEVRSWVLRLDALIL
jgi:hypothetical protein